MKTVSERERESTRVKTVSERERERESTRVETDWEGGEGGGGRGRGGTGRRWSRWLVLPIKARFSIPIDMHRVDK